MQVHNNVLVPLLLITRLLFTLTILFLHFDVTFAQESPTKLLLCANNPDGVLCCYVGDIAVNSMNFT